MRGGRPGKGGGADRSGGRGAGRGGRSGGPGRGSYRGEGRSERSVPARGSFDPHERKKTKRFRDRKDEAGGRGPKRDDERFEKRREGGQEGRQEGRQEFRQERRGDGFRGERKEARKPFVARDGERDNKRTGGDERRSFRPRFARGERDERGERNQRRERDDRKPQRERFGDRSEKRSGGRSERRFDKPRHSERWSPDRENNAPIVSVRTEPEKPAFESAGVQTVTVSGDEHDMRLDRFFEARFPGLSFSHIQRIIRKGEVRVDGKRAEPKSRLERGQQVRIPPLKLEAPKPRDDAPGDLKDRAFIKSITLYEDDDVMVLNKPMGLAVQGGSGTTRHVDGMLAALTPMGRDAQRPRLVHRLDKDTAGCLLVAKTRFAAAALAKTFRSRSARKIYWALVYGVPKPKQGRISTFLAKEQMEEDSYMRVASHGEDGASHAVTYYAIVESAAHQLSWVSLKPVTGRTHQLRAHMAHIRHPIVGDPKYFNIENWQFPGGLQNKLHLHAHRIAVPHPRGGRIDVTAPLPPHMEQSWNLLGFDAKRYDPIEDAPEE